MKKILFVGAVLIIFITMLSACGMNREICPAYTGDINELIEMENNYTTQN